jgi:hypothetical protein
LNFFVYFADEFHHFIPYLYANGVQRSESFGAHAIVSVGSFDTISTNPPGIVNVPIVPLVFATVTTELATA